MKGERSLEEEEVKSRSKRGACTGQTGLFGILFGVAYQPNIDCVNQELENFRGDVNGNIDNIKVIQNRMGNEHNKEMRETKSMVHKVRRFLLETCHQIDHLISASSILCLCQFPSPSNSPYRRACLKTLKLQTADLAKLLFRSETR